MAQVSPTGFRFACKGRRPKDWLWLDAVAASNAGENPKGGKKKPRKSTHADEIDKAIDVAVDFIRRYEAVGSLDSDMAKRKAISAIIEEFPELYEAYQINIAIDQHGSNQKFKIEALVMVEESPETISAYLALTPGIVRLYEQYFFDIRQMLCHRGYINSCLLSPALHGIVTKDNPDVFWKVLALAGGSNALMGYWEHGILDRTLEGMFTGIGRASEIKNYMVAAMGRSVNPRTERFIIESAIESRKVDIQAAQAGIGQENSKDAATALTATLAFTFDAHGVIRQSLDHEPRAPELLMQQLESANIKVRLPLQLPGPGKPEDGQSATPQQEKAQ